MAIDNEELKPISDIILTAVKESAKDCTTKNRCPICNGTLHFQEIGTSGILSCSADNCLKVTFRGI